MEGGVAASPLREEGDITTEREQKLKFVNFILPPQQVKSHFDFFPSVLISRLIIIMLLLL